MGDGRRAIVDGRSWSKVGMVEGRPRHAVALAACVKAKNLDDVVVYKEALAAEDEVSAILERPIFSKDLNTKGQLDRSSSRVAPLIAEGFGQLTDRHLATYLARARGSASETRTHLRKAHRKKFIPQRNTTQSPPNIRPSANGSRDGFTIWSSLTGTTAAKGSSIHHDKRRSIDQNSGKFHRP